MADPFIPSVEAEDSQGVMWWPWSPRRNPRVDTRAWRTAGPAAGVGLLPGFGRGVNFPAVPPSSPGMGPGIPYNPPPPPTGVGTNDYFVNLGPGVGRGIPVQTSPPRVQGYDLPAPGVGSVPRTGDPNFVHEPPAPSNRPYGPEWPDIDYWQRQQPQPAPTTPSPPWRWPGYVFPTKPTPAVPPSNITLGPTGTFLPEDEADFYPKVVTPTAPAVPVAPMVPGSEEGGEVQPWTPPGEIEGPGQGTGENLSPEANKIREEFYKRALGGRSAPGPAPVEDLRPPMSGMYNTRLTKPAFIYTNPVAAQQATADLQARLGYQAQQDHSYRQYLAAKLAAQQANDLQRQRVLENEKDRQVQREGFASAERSALSRGSDWDLRNQQYQKERDKQLYLGRKAAFEMGESLAAYFNNPNINPEQKKKPDLRYIELDPRDPTGNTFRNKHRDPDLDQPAAGAENTIGGLMDRVRGVNQRTLAVPTDAANPPGPTPPTSVPSAGPTWWERILGVDPTMMGWRQ